MMNKDFETILNELWVQMITKKGNVEIEIRDPVSVDSNDFSNYRPCFEYYKNNITEIHIPTGGNVYTTADGKMLLRRRDDGCLALEYAFGNLDYVEVPDGVDVIGACVFQQQPVISVVLPDSVSVIESSAFYNCKQLKTIRMPAKLKQIGQKAFFCCESLEQMTIPEEVEEIGEWSFYGCGKLTEIELPEKIHFIKSHTFFNCDSLRRVILKKGLKSIDFSAFAECVNLSDIQLPEGMMYIGEYAFSGCINIKHLRLPKSLKHLMDNSLSGIQAVEIAKPMPELARAFVEQAEGGKSYFSVIFEDRTLIFPNEMDGISMRKASEILTDIMELAPGVHSFYTFALTTKIKQETALESFLQTHDEEIGKYLRRSMSAILSREMEKEEETFLELIKNSSEEGILTAAAARKALSISEEKGWTLATADC